MFAPWCRPRRETSFQNGPPLRGSSRRTAACPLALEQLEGRTLLTAGALDPTFGTGGKAIVEFLGPVASEGAAVAAQPDGKIVVAGTAANRFAVVRYNVNGTLDTTFGTGGQVLTPMRQALNSIDKATAVAIQSDGKIIVAGLSDAGGDAFAVARYLPDGRLDDTFANGGRFLIAFPTIAAPLGIGRIVTQADGRIVLTGAISPLRPPAVPPPIQAFAMLGLTSRGTLDEGFGEGGRVFSSIVATGLALQSDSRIVVTGTDGTGSLFARYLTNGTLDNSFGSGGLLRIAPPPINLGALALQPDGRILVGSGYSIGFPPTSMGHALARYLPDGSLDPSFGIGGVVRTPLNTATATLRAITLEPEGKIVVVGTRLSAENSELVLARYIVGGTLDPSFGTGGLVFSNYLGRVRNQTAVDIVLSNGAIVLGGTALNASLRSTIALNRYTSSGVLDNTFGADGRVASELNGPFVIDQSARLLQADGKVILAGQVVSDTLLQSAEPQFALVRFNANGALDASFGTGGRVTTRTSLPSPAVAGVVAAPGEKILVVAFASSRADALALLRYNPDGSLDAGFGTGGVLNTRLGPEDSSGSVVSQILQQPDGRILVGGTYRKVGVPEPFFALVRFTADGTRDVTFTAAFPPLTPRFPPSDRFTAEIKGLALLPDGRILASLLDQGFTAAHALVRFNSDGNLDTTFGAGGVAIAEVAGRLAVLPDRRIVVAGTSERHPSPVRASVARYDASGNPDPTFGIGGKVELQFSPFSFSSWVTDLVVQSDGKIVIAGRQSGLFLARLDTNGTPDPTFGSFGQVIGSSKVQLTHLPSGRFLAAGSIAVNQLEHFGLARFLPDEPVANPQQRYVTQLYVDLLRRAPDDAGLNGFVSALERGQLTRAQVVQVFTASSEYRRVLVQELYRTFLRREPEPGGLNDAVSFLASGGTVAQVKAVLVGSVEYFQQRGSNNDKFLTAAYRDLLGREADPGGRQVFGQALAAGVSRTSLAGAILTSQEALEGIVRGWYARFLRRPADPNGVTGFVAALRQGMREEQLVSVFTGSDEYAGRLG